MADYHTQFSVILPLDAQQMVEARSLFAAKTWHPDYDPDDTDAEEFFSVGFEIRDDHPGFWITDEDGFGNPEALTHFVLALARLLPDLTGRWGFDWAYTCSKGRLEGFGGGAQMIDLDKGETTAWIDTKTWLAEQA